MTFRTDKINDRWRCMQVLLFHDIALVVSFILLCQSSASNSTVVARITQLVRSSLADTKSLLSQFISSLLLDDAPSTLSSQIKKRVE